MLLEFDSGVLERVRQLLAQSARIVITTHHNPDGDAIGSVLGLFHTLRKQGIASTVITPNGFPEFLQWMPDSSSVVRFTKEPERAEKLIKDAELIFCLDYNSFTRTESMAPILCESKAVKLLIDHHPDPAELFDIRFSYTCVSSTAELVYELIAALYGETAIEIDSAVCLYTGIVTDTGSFSYACKRGRTLEIAGKLIDKGVNVEAVHAAVYSNFSENRIRLLGYTLAEKLRVLPRYRTAYIWLTRDELKRFSFQMGDTEGFVNYPLTIKGVDFSALFIENEGFVKISLRSRGNFPANDFSERYYNGGGHLNAAGGKSFDSMENTLERFEDNLKEFTNLIKPE